MSIFQKRVDDLIKQQLDMLKKDKVISDDEAKEIHRKETVQAKINALIELEKKKEID
jgi:hypothetical protein